MVSIVVRLVLAGVLICGIQGCSAVKHLTTPPADDKKVVEQDVPDEAKSRHPGSPSQEPGVTEGPPAPEVQQPLPNVSPAERPPRRYNWSDRKGWSPGDPEKDAPRQ